MSDATAGGVRTIACADAVGRPAGLSLKIDGDFAQSICYDYGVDGHLSGMVLTNAQGRSVSVGHDWEQGRFAGYTVRDSSGDPIFERTVSRAPRRSALVTSVVHAGVAPSADTRSFSYAYDAVGRPVERGADAFAYNARGEVTNATIDSAAWSYAYDYIGNRTTASDTAGTMSYAANEVNQYTAVGSVEPDYDIDGNLVAFGNRTNAWSAPGRLASTMWTEAGHLARLRSEYDHRGRRVHRTLETSSDGGATWTVIDNRTFAYDDWNLIYERSERPSEGAAELAFFSGDRTSPARCKAPAASVDSWRCPSTASYHDAETGLYYYGYRYYSPYLGRCWSSARGPRQPKRSRIEPHCERDAGAAACPERIRKRPETLAAAPFARRKTTRAGRSGADAPQEAAVPPPVRPARRGFARASTVKKGSDGTLFLLY